MPNIIKCLMLQLAIISIGLPSFSEEFQKIIINLPGMPTDAKKLEMVAIPAGSFVMGSPEDERGHFYAESPQHTVTFKKPFYMSVYEVTQAQWQSVIGINPAIDSGFGFDIGDDYPTSNISWDDCKIFIAHLNQTGQGNFRLPSEAEWEYACRAGTTGRFSFVEEPECSDDGRSCDILNQYAWWYGTSRLPGVSSGPQQVGQKLPNPWGLYDMHGNLSEWCEDFYHRDYHGAPSDGRAWIDNYDDDLIIHRGGSWQSTADYCRSAERGMLPAVSSFKHVAGLRLVRDYEPQPASISDWQMQ